MCLTQVSELRSFLRDLCMVPCGNLPKLPAAFRLGAKMDKGKAQFAQVRETHDRPQDSLGFGHARSGSAVPGTQ